MINVLLLLAFTTAACCAVTAGGCKSLVSNNNELQVPPLSYQSHENYVLFGKLTACPLAEQPVSDDELRFLVTPKDGVSVVLLNERHGDFMFTPGADFAGIVTFWYHVERGGESSEPATVTINVQRKTILPSVTVSQHIMGLEDGSVELDIAVDNQGSGQWDDLSVAICSCAHDITCNRERGDCHCHLSLPDGWEIYDGQRLLNITELSSLSPSSAADLILRAGPLSAAEHCLAVNVVIPTYGDDPSVDKKQVTVRIHPIHSTVLMTSPSSSSFQGNGLSGNQQLSTPRQGAEQVSKQVPHPEQQPPTFTTTTTQGAPYVFRDLHVLDMNRVDRAGDGEDGQYIVSVQLDQGGQLWVRQDLREDVVFLPETAEIHPEALSADKVYELKHRHGIFETDSRPFPFEKTNNGGSILRFKGSLEGINEVLSTLTYVPWCSEWPTPPSWPLPERSWMEVSDEDLTLDVHRPDIWPQWYPRFLYPFASRHWTWWPRILPPWWMTITCSNWTSHVHLKVREVPSVTCQQAEPAMADWLADIAVITSGESPKSLVTSNHFTYFKPNARIFHVDTVYMRSLQYDFGMNLHFNLTVLEPNLASAEFSSTGMNHFDCQTIEECNDQLMNISVTFRDHVQDVCMVSLQIDMYKGTSNRLGDQLVIWGMNTTRECLDVSATHPDFELTARPRVLHMRQGSINRKLHLGSNVQADDLQGILHVQVIAEHGLVTMKVPDGLRPYYDHMGQHGGGIPTYLCIAGPVAMVMEALSTARFTPFTPLHGKTAILVDYRMPSAAARRLHGEAQPFRRLQLMVNMLGGILPYMPLIQHPPEVCINTEGSLPVDMATVVRRFQEDERITFSMMSERGSLRLNTQDRGLYECPIVSPGEFGACVEQCGNHDDCPVNNMCCSNGCGHSCQQATLRANLQITNSRMVMMHGSTHDVNQNLLRGAVQYTPVCLGADAQSYTDTIKLRVNPARNPEGDSVRTTIPIHVACASESQQGVVPTEAEECELSAWTPCLTVRHACGISSQGRSHTCPTHGRVETRSCLNCSCSLNPITIRDPFPNMQECSSVVPIPRCPDGCSVASFHVETVEFQCQPPPGTTDTDSLIQRETNVQIHDVCSCDACSSFQQEE